MMNDPYETLDVDKNASEQEIKKAYRDKARKHHPDKNNGKEDSVKKFQEIQAAYALLKNPNRKRQYDKTGSTEPVKDDAYFAEELVANAYEQLVIKKDFEPCDYISELRNAFQNDYRHILRIIEKKRRVVSDFKRVIADTESGVVVMAILKAKIKEREDELHELEWKQKILQLAMDVLDKSKYTGEVEEKNPWSADFNFFDPHIES